MSSVDAFLRRQELENKLWAMEKKMRIIQKLSQDTPNLYNNTRIYNVTVDALLNAESK